MKLSQGQLGALRSLAVLVGYAVIQAVLSFFVDPANAASVFGVGFSGLVVILAGSLEQFLAAQSKGTAMFGAVKVK